MTELNYDRNLKTVQTQCRVQCEECKGITVFWADPRDIDSTLHEMGNFHNWEPGASSWKWTCSDCYKPAVESPCERAKKWLQTTAQGTQEGEYQIIHELVLAHEELQKEYDRFSIVVDPIRKTVSWQRSETNLKGGQTNAVEKI